MVLDVGGISCLPTFREYIGEAEVNNFDIQVLVKEKVLSLQVSVNNMVAMAIVYRLGEGG